MTNAGQIGYAQSGCAPFDPAEIISVSDPSGGSGNLEYVWLSSTNGGSNYTMISGANGSSYNPSVITETTWYRRCARREGCEVYVGESNWVKVTVGTTNSNVNVAGTNVTCQTENSNECQVVDYANGTHALWLNSLSSGTKYYKFEGGRGTLVENEDGTAHFSGILYNTLDANKRWLVDVKLEDKKTWAEWSAQGGDWKGNAGTVGNNYTDWSYYEISSSSRLIGIGDWSGTELTIARMVAAQQYRVQVGLAANDKNGNYGLSTWFDFNGSGESGSGDFNFDIQNCVERGCDGTATASVSGGTAPYTYVWENGMTTSSIDGLCAGTYCVSVIDATGCESDEVYAGEDISICVGESVMLTATGGNEGVVYTWLVDGQEVGTGETIVVSPGVGLTEYTVVASNDDCSIVAEDEVKVWVNDYPIAGFVKDLEGEIILGEEVTFTDTAIGFVTDWHWDLGDGTTTMVQEPSHIYQDPGTYLVTLVVENNGCADTASSEVEVKVIIDIPNVFTPNSDGQNDMIWLEGTDVDMMSMTIYNRWGHSMWAGEGRAFG